MSISDTEPGTISLIGSGAIKAIQIHDFLSVSERDALFGAVCEEHGAFVVPGASDTENSTTRFLSCSGAGNNKLVRATIKPLSSKVNEHMPHFMEALGLESFPFVNEPFTVISGRQGHNGTPHADTFDGQRQMTVLYYFHKVPKAFSGGDLEFYASNEKSAEGYYNKAVCSVKMEDNMLIVFSSEIFHGVTEVQSDSEDFADSRFVAVSFFKALQN